MKDRTFLVPTELFGTLPYVSNLTILEFRAIVRTMWGLAAARGTRVKKNYRWCDRCDCAPCLCREIEKPEDLRVREFPEANAA